MRCPVCDTHDNWQDINHILRRQGDRLVICRTCAFPTYLDVDEKSLRDAYAKSDFSKERVIAGTQDYITKLSKLPLNRVFLHAFLESRPGLRIIDIGCSTGYLLRMLRDEFGYQDVSGTEWNPVHAKFGRHGYGLDIRKNIEDFGARRFDLICMLQVLEHMKDPDLFLTKLMEEYLAEDGVIYISVPVWFDLLGLPSMFIPFPCDMDGVLVPGHINVFSMKNFLNLLHKVGLEILEDNYTFYGYRALLVRGGAVHHQGYDDFTGQTAVFERQKQALTAYAAQDYPAALAHYPKFPMATVQHIFRNCSGTTAERIRAAEEAAALMPGVEQFPWIVGNAYFAEKNYDQAQFYFERAHRLNPGAVEPLWQIAEIMKIKGDFPAAARLFELVIALRPDLQFNPLEPGKPTCLDQLSNCYLHCKDDYY